MINIRIVYVGKLKERFYIDAANEYSKRLGGYCKMDIVNISEHRLPEKPSALQIAKAQEKERDAIREKLLSRATAVALCVEGLEMNSRELSEFLSRCAANRVQRLCFIIGGSYGLHEDIKSASVLRLSLSKMTLPHNLAQVVLLEQLYRAFTIAEGGKYHK